MRFALRCLHNIQLIARQQSGRTLIAMMYFSSAKTTVPRKVETCDLFGVLLMTCVDSVYVRCADKHEDELMTPWLHCDADPVQLLVVLLFIVSVLAILSSHKNHLCINGDALRHRILCNVLALRYMY